MIQHGYFACRHDTITHDACGSCLKIESLNCGEFEAYSLGVKVRNTKMDSNIYGTWRWVTFEKLMMKIYDFFYSAKSFSHPV